MATLTVSAFEKAINQMIQAVEFADKHKALGEMDYFKLLRTAAIQSFEYSYDIGQKLIRRYIEVADAYEDENRHQDFRDYARIAAEYGLIKDPEEWVEFREWRNDASHAFDEDLAQELFNTLPSTIKSMRYTCNQLREKFDASR